jgi:type I restriction enzyme S subunit
MLKQGLLQLPKGWKWVKLGDIITQKPQYGLTAKSTRESNEVVYIRISDINEDGKLKTDDLRYVKLDKETFKKYELKENDVIIARSGSVGRVYIHKDFGKPCVFASYLIRFNLNRNLILPKFFFYFSFTLFYRNFIAETLKIVAQPNINARQFSRLLIPLPPLEEQKRIVAKLDEIFSRIEKARKLREEALKEAEQIMQSALNEIFSKAEEKGWKLVRLKEISRFNPKITEIKALSDDTKVSFVPMSSIDEITGSITSQETRKLRDVKKGYTYFKENDVLFAKITPCMENGKSAIAKNLINGIGFGSTEFHVIRPDYTKVFSEWIYFFIRRKSFREEATKYFTGSVGHQRVPVEFLQNSFIPLPSLDEQKRWIKYLTELQEKVILLKRHQEETQKEIEMLTSSVLNKAFTGELA